MSRRGSAQRLTIAIALLLAPLRVGAEPPLPKAASYFSANRHYRLTVHPRPLADPVAYAGRACDPAAAEDPAPPAEAVMERRGAGGAWTRVWARALPNAVAPVQALISDDGAHAVTLGNWNAVDREDDGSVTISFGRWSSVDTGENLIVIHGEGGRQIRALALKDLLPPDYIRALQWSISPWAREAGLSSDGKRLLLDIMVPPEEQLSQESEGVEIAVDLATGEPIRGGAAWEAAVAKASKVVAAARADKAESEARLLAPLLGPHSSDAHDWHVYVVEAHRRLKGDSDLFGYGIALPERSSPEYAQQADAIELVLRDPPDGTSVPLFASPSQEALLEVMSRAARKVKPGGLKGGRVYVAVGDALRDRFAAALAHTGVEFVQIDPSEPIPQRPNRLEEEEALADSFGCIVMLGS